MEKQEGILNPQEHTRWAKQRAFRLLESGSLKQAIDSMVSDLAKDPTRSREQVSMIVEMGLSIRNDAALNEQKVREFIEGFTE